MIIRDEKYGGGRIRGEVLKSVIEEHMGGQERRRKLQNAYRNQHDILNRKRGKGLPNVRLSHGFAKYIVTMATGHLMGQPVMYKTDAQNTQTLEALLQTLKEKNAQKEDVLLAKDMSVYGKGVELLYGDECSKPCFTRLDPNSAFVVYDDCADFKSMFGVHMVRKYDEKDALCGYLVHVYTKTCIFAYQVEKLEDMESAQPFIVTEHYFGDVPMIEYFNDETETGDFEQVLSLIDAYDILQSDRVNDKQQFVDALLILTGATMETDEWGRSPARQLIEDKILCLPDSECKAEYLARSMTEQDVEILKNALRNDIHKFSFVPDLTDELFSGNTSGVAMKYKLLGLEQLVRVKEQFFKEGLKKRLQQVAQYLYYKGGKKLDVNKVQIVLARSLPVNELEVAQTLKTYETLVPKEVLLSQIPFVENPKEVMEKEG